LKQQINNFPCIACPIGCELEVTQNGEDIEVRGNKCKRGSVYGREEVLFPTRMVTMTLECASKTHKRIPVFSQEPVPKDKVMEWVKAVEKTLVKPPVHIGDTVSAGHLGIAVIASRSINT
jgi:CxxC motif-containing protein